MTLDPQPEALALNSTAEAAPAASLESSDLSTEAAPAYAGPAEGTALTSDHPVEFATAAPTDPSFEGSGVSSSTFIEEDTAPSDRAPAEPEAASSETAPTNVNQGLDTTEARSSSTSSATGDSATLTAEGSSAASAKGASEPEAKQAPVRHIFLKGPRSSGKSIALAALVAWARLQGWVVRSPRHALGRLSVCYATHATQHWSR